MVQSGSYEEYPDCDKFHTEQTSLMNVEMKPMAHVLDDK